jgi:hypothetical protein
LGKRKIKAKLSCISKSLQECQQISQQKLCKLGEKEVTYLQYLKKNKTVIQDSTGGVAQVAEHLPRNYETLSLNPSIDFKKSKYKLFPGEINSKVIYHH